MTKTYSEQRRRRQARAGAEARAALTESRRQRNVLRAPSVEKRRLMDACYRALAFHIERETDDCLRQAWIANKSRMIRDKVMTDDADFKGPIRLDYTPRTIPSEISNDLKSDPPKDIK